MAYVEFKIKEGTDRDELIEKLDNIRIDGFNVLACDESDDDGCHIDFNTSVGFETMSDELKEKIEADEDYIEMISDCIGDDCEDDDCSCCNTIVRLHETLMIDDKNLVGSYCDSYYQMYVIGRYDGDLEYTEEDSYRSEVFIRMVKALNRCEEIYDIKIV